jgi:Divergent InlB B-repeat domain
MLASVLAASIDWQTRAQSTNAPLYLSINGGGNVSPLTNGQLLVVGQSYNMVATPDAGFAFTSWEPVNVFTTTEVVLDAYGNPLPPVVSIVAALIPAFTYEASLSFVMQPVTVIYDVPGVRTVTKGSGWQANFEPVVLNTQLGDSALILSWPTNSTGFALQSTTNLASPVWTTNLPSPVIINGQNTVTNPISGTQQFFRLSQ